METEEILFMKDSFNDIEMRLDDLFQLIKEKTKERATQSDDLNELATALAKAQSEIEVAGRKETNPFFKSKYADLAELIKVSRPALTKNGLAVMQQITTDMDAMTWLHTLLVHTSGQWIETRMRVIPVKNDVQSFGSCITYLRRYCYAALINIAVADEDDDGEAAVYDNRNVVAKGTALNTKYNPKENVQETITKEQREELEYELTNYPDIAEMIIDGFKIRSIADMPKGKFMAAVLRVREIKQAREGK